MNPTITVIAAVILGITPVLAGTPLKGSVNTAETSLKIGFKGIYPGTPKSIVREQAKDLGIDIDDPQTETKVTFANCTLRTEPSFTFEKSALREISFLTYPEQLLAMCLTLKARYGKPTELIHGVYEWKRAGTELTVFQDAAAITISDSAWKLQQAKQLDKKQQNDL